MIRHRKTRRQSQLRIVANGRIRAPQVRVVDEQGELVGVMSTKDAQSQAYATDKDLVLINEQQNPPIAKIIDLAKFKYQQQQKDAAGRKKAKSQSIKEVRLTPFMSEGDFQARMKKINSFLEKGDKVRLTLMYKGRQITKKEFGEQMINKAIEQSSEWGEVEIQPKMIGRKLIAQLTPKK